MYFAIIFLSISILFAPYYYLKNKVGDIVYAAVAGRSGGHILPALTLLDKLKQKELNKSLSSKVIFFSTDSALDNSIIGNSNIVDHHIRLKLPNLFGNGPFGYVAFSFLGVYAFLRSLISLMYFQPCEVISTGGYIGIPVCLAARILKIPVNLYELNVEPGKASRVLGPLATNIHICFPEACKFFASNKTRTSSYPVRFNEQSLSINREEACKILCLDPNKKIVFIIGGSQGSQFINNLVCDWLKTVTDKSAIQIIHQTGKKDLQNLAQFYEDQNLKACVFDYKKDINLCYSAANIVVSRAGAGSLSEIIFFKKQSIIIPLYTKENQHQIDNGRSVQNSYPNLIKLCDQQKIENNPSLFFNLLNDLISNLAN